MTEDEADEAYEEFCAWIDKPPLEVDRFDAHVVRVYLDKQALESKAQLVESQFEPSTTVTFCACGHVSASHKGEEASCNVNGCGCRAFVRDTQRGKGA